MKDEIDLRRSEAVNVKNVMPSLLGHQGWSILRSCMSEEIKNLQIRINQPAMREEDVRRAEGMKGELRAIQRVMETPAHMIDDAQSVIDALTTPEDNQDE